MDNLPHNEIIGILGEVVRALTKLQIPYMLTGSLASGIRGTFRATNDIDILAAIDSEHVSLFCEILAENFFVDELSVSQAVKEERSFNIIHQTMLIKVDFFVRRTDPRSATQIHRASLVNIPPLLEPIRTATAEDVILSKLQWYEMGNRVSERQWRDILGVLASNPELDQEYLERSASELQLESLLKAAFEQQTRSRL